MAYVLDTCTLLWWTLAPAMLSPAAATACGSIEQSGDGVLSAISIWEVGIKVRGGKLSIGMTIEAYHQRLKQIKALEIVPVDDLNWLRNLALSWDHRDPADRTIVALAELRDLPIVTKDATIRAFYPRTVW